MRRILQCSGPVPSGSSAASSSFWCSASASFRCSIGTSTRGRLRSLSLDCELLYERGILSKDRTSVSLKHVRAVHVTRGFLNRILGVGTYPNLDRGRSAGVHGGGHAGPWNDQRNDLESAEPRRGLGPACRARTTIAIRKGATRLLLAAAVALILLVAIVWGGLYTFRDRLGLKNAALISFGVSLAVILVMAVVSGGRRVSDFLRDLLADDRLDLLGELTRRGRASGPAAGKMAPPRSAAPALRQVADDI